MTKRENIQAIYPLTSLQQGILFHTICRPELNLYFEQISGDIEGMLDYAAFEGAWQQVVDRHDILRTAFVWHNLEEPLQVVGQRVRFPFEVHDGTVDDVPSFLHFLENDKRRGFLLTQAPLMRLKLLRVSPTMHRFVWSHHHLILDGWSWSVLLREVFECYAARLESRAPVLPKARPFRAFVNWIQRQDLVAAEVCWRHALSGFNRKTHILEDRSTGVVVGDSEECLHPLHLAFGVSSNLRALSHHTGVTMNTIVQGAFALLLARHSYTQDVLFGSMTALRPSELIDVETMVGLLINVVPVRIFITENTSVHEWLSAIQAYQLRANAYHWAPLAQISRWSDLPPGVNLFDYILSFQNFPALADASFSCCGLLLHNVSWTGPTNYSLVLRGAASDDLMLTLGYHPSRYSSDDIAVLAQDLEKILACLAAGPNGRLKDIQASLVASPLQTIALRDEQFDFE